jgi:hypothetical protein
LKLHLALLEINDWLGVAIKSSSLENFAFAFYNRGGFF